MSIQDLDLDINNYNMRDLEAFFRLNPEQKYTAADIEEKEITMRTLLISSGEVDKRQQKDLMEFLNLAKDWLIYVKCSPQKIQNIQDNSFDKLPTSRTNEITERKNTIFLNTQNSDVFPGVINPLNTRIITKSLNIDTRFRDNYYKTKSSDFVFNLPNKLNKVISMTLSALELPINFYSISDHLNNNFLYIKINHVENFTAPEIPTNGFDINSESLTFTDSEKIITIPDGNYNESDLIDTLNSLIGYDSNTTTSNDIFSYIKFDLDLTANGSGTSKLNINSNGHHSNKVKSISLDFTLNKNKEFDKSIPYSYRIGTNLGFINRSAVGYPKLEADAPIQISTIRYLYLIIDDYNNNSNNHIVGVFNNSIMSSNILARISVTGSFFSIMTNDEFKITSEPRKYFGPVDIQKIHVRLTDEYGRTINMNNSDFSFCLNFKLIYDL